MEQRDDETGTSGQGVTEFDAKREAYEAAVAHRRELIDNPDRSMPWPVYRDLLRAAVSAVDDAHKDMLEAWTP